jgi:hypothetical protein
MSDARRYCAYLLRGWMESQADGNPYLWRFRVQDVHTGDQWALSGKEAVVACLAQAFPAHKDSD